MIHETWDDDYTWDDDCAWVDNNTYVLMNHTPSSDDDACIYVETCGIHMLRYDNSCSDTYEMIIIYGWQNSW
jgi:hypothetical protein